MAQLVYLDETGSVGRGAKRQKYLRLVAAVVDESRVQDLGRELNRLAAEAFGTVPNGFEFHGHDVWGGSGYWEGVEPPALLAAFEGVIELIDDLEVSIVHSAIDKARLNAKYRGAFDDSAYLLALQFLLEKLDVWGHREHLRILIADEAKQEQLRAIEMVADLQRWSTGEVPGRQLRTVIDSMHFVQSCHSPGVQLADMIAYVLHRSDLARVEHPDAAASLSRMLHQIAAHTPTYRQPWPS